jgi:hypothetical protein
LSKIDNGTKMPTPWVDSGNILVEDMIWTSKELFVNMLSGLEGEFKWEDFENKMIFYTLNREIIKAFIYCRQGWTGRSL